MRVSVFALLFLDVGVWWLAACVVVMNITAWTGYAGMRAEVAAVAPGPAALTLYGTGVAAVEALGAASAALLPASILQRHVDDGRRASSSSTCSRCCRRCWLPVGRASRPVRERSRVEVRARPSLPLRCRRAADGDRVRPDAAGGPARRRAARSLVGRLRSDRLHGRIVDSALRRGMPHRTSRTRSERVTSLTVTCSRAWPGRSATSRPVAGSKRATSSGRGCSPGSRTPGEADQSALTG